LAGAFTGLAGKGEFWTHQWLLEALMEAAKPECLMESTIMRLTDIATRDVGKLGLPKSRKRLSIVLCGYHYAEAPPRAYLHIVTNFEDEAGLERPEAADAFRNFYWREQRPFGGSPAIIWAAGTTRGLTDDDLQSLRSLLEGGKPPRALVGKGVEIIRRAADLPVSGGLVGRACNSIVIPSDARQEVFAEFHASDVGHETFLPSCVVASVEKGIYAVMEPVESAHDESGKPPPLAVPKVGRNEPCPCGSGKKYKRCHGRRV